MVNTGPDGRVSNDIKASADADWFGSVGADGDEPNNTLEQAKDLGYVTNTWSQNGKTLDSLNDVDWYKFTILTATGPDCKVLIGFADREGGLALGLYRQDGSLIGQVDTTGDSEQISLAGLSAGTYLIRVWGDHGDVSRNYKLTIVAPAAPSPVSADHLVSMSVGAMDVDRYTGLTSCDVTINNTSQSVIVTPLWLAVGPISDRSVSLIGSNGKTNDGLPYIAMMDQATDGRLDPGETVTVRVSFRNPLRRQFEFQLFVLGVVAPDV